MNGKVLIGGLLGRKGGALVAKAYLYAAGSA